MWSKDQRPVEVMDLTPFRGPVGMAQVPLVVPGVVVSGRVVHPDRTTHHDGAAADDPSGGRLGDLQD